MKKTALITGASGGIGSAIAKELSQTHRVLLHYYTNKVQATKLREEILCSGGDAWLFQGDLSSYEGAKKMFDEIHRCFPFVHLLVNSVGYSSYRLFQDESPETWNKIFQVNVGSVFYSCHFLFPSMLQRKEGKIINISSVWGITGAAGESAYASTKGAINTLTKSLALEAGYSNVQVNAVAPGAVDTEMLSPLSSSDLEVLKKEIPAGRFATPEEIGKLVAFLASPYADYINGQIISPNGGLTTY